MTFWQILLIVLCSVGGTIYGCISGRKRVTNQLLQNSVDKLAYDYLTQKLSHKGDEVNDSCNS